MAMIANMKTDLGRAQLSVGKSSTQRRKDAKTPGQRQVLFASSRLCAFALILLPLCLGAATNDLTSALQKGLFEEEANHNLEAAAQAYQAVSAQFDKDRKLAATAIFRLGEVYRKQGKTNEAALQYERIVREFSDQQTLATLSQQNLAGIGRGSLPDKPVTGRSDTVALIAKARGDVIAISAELDRLKTLPREEMRVILQQNYSTPVIVELQKQLLAAEQNLAARKKDYAQGHPEVLRLTAQVETIYKQIDAQATALVMGFEAKLETAKAVLAQLEKASLGDIAAPASDGAAQSTTDDEEKEIRRIQALIQNSPDLINAGQTPPIFPAVEAGYLKVVRFLLDHGAEVNARSQGATPLHVAAKRGQRAMAELLLSRGADVKARNTSNNTASRDRTPLHEAAEEGFQAVVEVLLANKAAVSASDAGGNTPLHLAAKRNRPKVVGLLAPKAPDVNSENSTGITPLGFAAGYGSPETVKALLDAGPDVNAGKRDQPLFTAITFGKDPVVIEMLLCRGAANPNQVGVATPSGHELGSSSSYSTTTPLRLAVSRGNPDIVKLLLKFKADANTVDESGRTPLSHAGLNTNVVKLLLEAKADPNLGSTESPLMQAVRAENAILAEMLLRAGADPNQPTDCALYSFGLAMPTAPGLPGYPGGGFSRVSPRRSLTRTGQTGKRTPLQAAVTEDRGSMVKLVLQFKGDAKANGPEGFPLVLSALDNAEMLKALLEAGADANANDGKDRYPLITAASAGNSVAVDLLLAHGAKTEVLGPDGAVPLLGAISVGCSNCVASLLAAGADVNIRTATDWSAVHSATYYGRKVILQMLLAKGANPNVRNNEGKTPLDLTKPQPAGIILPTRPGEEPRASMQELADLLRQYGALDDLPDFKSIRFTRGTITPLPVFYRDTNSLNRFTLFEALANHFGASADFTGGLSSFSDRLNALRSARAGGPLRFPDLARIRIQRSPISRPTERNEIPVNLLGATNGLDCAKDVPLEFGDVIEIPEREHTLAEPEIGLTTTQLRELETCLERTVRFVVRTETVELKLPGNAAWLTPALNNPQVQRILRSTSDLSRVKVKRSDPKSGNTQAFRINTQERNGSNDLWLRDGDVIEVPDK